MGLNKPYVRKTMGELPKSPTKIPFPNPLFIEGETPDVEPTVLRYVSDRLVYFTKGPNRQQRRRIAKGRDPWTGRFKADD